MNSVKYHSIILMLLLLATSFVYSQGNHGNTGKNRIFIIGQVTNNENGAPIEGQEILVISDSSYNQQFNYNTKLYTDDEGYFYDTIMTDQIKGGLNLRTFDFQNQNYDTTLYFRFSWSEQNILFANFILPVDSVPEFYQANFSYIRNPGGDSTFTYQFIDKTNSDDIFLWEWNFGDGNFSNEANPLHEYSEPGTYKVKLTVHIQLPSPPEVLISSIVKIFNITIKDYYSFGGHVFAGDFPIDKGFAYLYDIENDIIIDTAIFSEEYGYYYFYQVIEGNYFVRADLDPNSVLFDEYMATYYSDKLIWTEADTVFHNNNYFNYDIYLIPKEQLTTGPGKISGTISYSVGTGDNKSVPAYNVELLLLNENNQPFICCHSNQEGEFAFYDLELNSYKVHAEVTGKYTYPVNVTLDYSNQEIENVEIIISNYTVDGSVNGINDNIRLNTIGEIYPNPVSDIANLSVNFQEDTDLQMSLYNNTGQLIYEFYQTAYSGKNNITVNVAGIQPGIYFLKINNSINNGIIRKFIKQ
ncbi:MAG: T9SS type A sorting domain-containing protein [Bacteroidales bacterium]|nr:T9SS type A sorting domain-containing protein [Bacteroidales bacterium]